MTKPPVQPSEASLSLWLAPCGQGDILGDQAWVSKVFHIAWHCIIKENVNSSKNSPTGSSFPPVTEDGRATPRVWATKGLHASPAFHVFGIEQLL